MKNKKILVISLAVVVSLFLAITLAYFTIDSFNKNVNEALYNMTIDFEKAFNGYSSKEIEDKVKYSQINLSDDYLYSIKDKHIIEFNNKTDDETFENVEHFEVHTNISYYLKNDALKEVNVNGKEKTINIVLLEPYSQIDDYHTQINYLDKKRGLLSLNDLRLDEDNLNKVYKLIDDSLKPYLDEYLNIDKAKETESTLYKKIYEDLLKDIVGSSLFSINITFNEEA